MQKLPTALAISAAVHVIAVAWVWGHEREPVLALLPTPEPVAVELVDVPRVPRVPHVPRVEPLAVALIEPPVGAGAERIVTRRARPQAIAATTVPTTTIIEPAPTRPPHPMMSLRRAPDLRLRQEVAEQIASVSITAPEAARPGTLEPAGAGTRADQGSFTMDVDASGDVRLKDKRNLQVSIPSPKQILKGAGKGIADWYENPNKTPDGSEVKSGEDTKPDHGKTVPIVEGSFDLTDALMRRKGHDPYFSKKLKALDSTRDERAEIGARHRKRQLARSTELVQKQLVHLWASTPDAVARKQALFELWDDCAESGDPAIVEGGQAARRLVVGFIRSRLPAGTPAAFTAAEVAELNRKKQSVAAFAPYQ